MEESIFTKIIKGKIPSYKVYEDEKTMAFLDIHPETYGHVLVVPKVQCDKIYELPEEEFLALMKAVRKISARMEEVLGKRVIWKVIGVDVPHAHVHVMPYDENWKPGDETELSPEEMEELRQKLVF